MKREIKFRAWWKQPKYMPEGKMYRVGGLIMGDKEEGEPEYWFKDTQPVEIGLIEMEGKSLKIGWNPASQCVLMQFTGLKDKNGKEIYEGDVLQYKKIYMLVFMDQHKGWWGVRFPNKFKTQITKRQTEFFKSLVWAAPKSEIVGNVYENPDLLK